MGRSPPPPPMVYAPPLPPTVSHFSHRSKVVAGVLQILVPFGAGRFYTGHYGIAVAQLLTCGGLGVWCLIDGIILLAGSNQTDAEGRLLRD
ncbi:TM2 domain-containing protein [Actinokineospora soli]|uniref:TM2 domain-containing protein n=1 Tax=Actinokineospora soli TaxID=1048753 RepID=A0ABW2TN41_9PSEU